MVFRANAIDIHPMESIEKALGQPIQIIAVLPSHSILKNFKIVMQWDGPERIDKNSGITFPNLHMFCLCS